MMKRKNVFSILSALLLCCFFHVSYGQGARYTGNYTRSAQIKHVNKKDITIEGLEIANTGEIGIALYSCENVTIRNCKISASPTKAGIYLYGCKNVTITDCTFENVQSGLVVSTSQRIKFEFNDLTNIVGPLKGGDRIGVMAQFIQVSGPGNSVSYNVCENFRGESSPEDLINMNQSNGTKESPIMIKGNWIRGGGPSDSGGGINLGDIGGSYQVAEDNILVNVGQYGIGISGGNNMALKNNKVYGAKQSFTNVGIVACNWYQNLGNSSNITISGNSVNYTNKDGQTNNWWFAGNMGTIAGKETNKYDASLTAAILPEKIIGRARTSGTTDPGVEEQPGQTKEDEADANISIYVDSYNRICVNCKGQISHPSTGRVFVMNQSGKTVYVQTILRYHTVVQKDLSGGTYTVSVQDGDKKLEKSVTIPQ